MLAGNGERALSITGTTLCLQSQCACGCGAYTPPIQKRQEDFIIRFLLTIKTDLG